MEKDEMGLLKNRSIRSFLGLKDKTFANEEVSPIDVFCNKQTNSATKQPNPIQKPRKTTNNDEFRIFPVTAKMALCDVLLEPKYNKVRTCRWKLKLKPQWNDYILIFVKLQYNSTLLRSLYSDIKDKIDYVQHLEGGGLLVHCKTIQFYFKLLRLVAPVYSVYMVLSNGVDSVITIKNNIILQAMREMNLQIVKYKVPFPRISFTVWGINSNVPQKQLITYFKSIGKLISWKFASNSPNTKYHVIYLQYSRFSVMSDILNRINNFHSAKVMQNLERK